MGEVLGLRSGVRGVLRVRVRGVDGIWVDGGMWWTRRRVVHLRHLVLSSFFFSTSSFQTSRFPSSSRGKKRFAKVGERLPAGGAG